MGFTLTTAVPGKTGSTLGAWSKCQSDPDLLSLRATGKVSRESTSAGRSLSSQFNVGKVRLSISGFSGELGEDFLKGKTPGTAPSLPSPKTLLNLGLL